MPVADFFSKFGLYAVRNFLDRDFRERLCEEMANAPQKKGMFLKPHSDHQEVDESYKKRSEATNLPEKSVNRVKRKLIDLMPEIGRHYQLELKDIQAPKFSIYRNGDFYKAHVDRIMNREIPAPLKERKISVIIFLNEESQIEKQGSYCGGNLTFYGLMENEVFKNYGLPLQSEPGMLITFPPTLLHEVTTVTAGERFTIVTWYI